MSSSNSSYNTDESDGLGYLDDYDEDCHCINPLLERDIQLMKTYYPKEAVTYRVLSDLREVDIEFTVNLGFLEKIVLHAWGLKQELPLIFKIIMDLSCYSYRKNDFRLEVFQSKDCNKQTAVLIQLKDIAVDFSEKYFSKHKIKLQDEMARIKDGVDIEQDSSETKGFLVQLYERMQDRIRTLNNFCPICDRLHGATAMLKPAVCSRPLCIFSFQAMGVMCQVTDALQTQPEVVNLLIAFTFAAAVSSRYGLVLDPFPDLVDSVTREYIFVKDDLGHVLLRKIMRILSEFNYSRVSSESQLKEKLSKYHKRSYPVLRWIISSNRSHIMKVPKEMQLKFLLTDHQFLLRNSPPDVDVQFRLLAKQYGSCFAFHGSPLENWHSIIRKGLVVASGTNLQLHGSALGKGIYVTPSLQMSLDYAASKTVFKCAPLGKMDQAMAMLSVDDQESQEAKGGESDSDDIETKSVILSRVCVTLCEVITGPALKKKKDFRWVVEDSQHICTRFFFLYEEQKALSPLQSTHPEFEDSVRKILANM